MKSDNYKIESTIVLDSTMNEIIPIDSTSLLITDSVGNITKLSISGDTLWQNEVSGTINKSVISNNQIIVSTQEGDLISFDLKNGDQIISIGLDEKITNGPSLFSYSEQNNMLNNSGSEKNNGVLIGIEKGKLTAYDINSFEEIWSFTESRGKILSNILQTDNKAIFSNSDGHIYCIDLEKGWLIWKWKFPKNLKQPFILSDIITDNKFIYFVLTDKHLYKADILLGKLIWQSKPVNEKGILFFDNRNNIVTQGEKNHFIILSSKSGKILKKLHYPEKNFTIATNYIRLNNTILFGSKNGNLYEFRKDKFLPVLIVENSPIKILTKIDTDKFILGEGSGKIFIIKKIK